MCAKLRAAAAARKRCRPGDSWPAPTPPSVSGIDDAIERAKRYLDAGADWIFPEALATRGEFERFAQAIDAPLVANMTEFGKSPLLSLDELADLGYAAVLYPVTLLRVAMKAVEAALATLANDGTQAELLDLMQTRQELYDLLGYEDYEARDRAYFQARTNRRAETMTEPIYSPWLGRGRRRRNGHQHDHRRPGISRLFGRRAGPARDVRGSGLFAAARRTAERAASWRHFPQRLHAAAQLPEPLVELLRQIPAAAPLMDVMRTGASALAHWDPRRPTTATRRMFARPSGGWPSCRVVLAARHRLMQGKEPVADRRASVAGRQYAVDAVSRGADRADGAGDGRVADSVRRARVQRLDVHGPRGRFDVVRSATRPSPPRSGR